MKSQEKNKQLYLDREAISALGLLHDGLLYPVVKLMDKKEAGEVSETGLYKGCSYPCPLLLSPSGKRNQKVLRSIKKGEEIELICEMQSVGSIIADSVFQIDKEERLAQIGAILEEQDHIAKRIGEYAISGELKLNIPKSPYKEILEEKKRKLNAKKVTGIIFNANPIHRVHEKILREEFNDTDLIVIFLLRYSHDGFLSYDLRKACLDLVLSNFLNEEKICIIPLDSTYLFAGQNKMILYSLIAKNYGCSKILLGQNSSQLGVYYINQERHSIFDTMRGIDIEVKILDEFAYCTQCRCLLNTTSCPHGKHHHIAYNSPAILQFFKMGILPPIILVRKEVSILILKTLFPHRIEEMKKIYYNVLPSEGMFSEDIQKDFYNTLMGLYQIKN